MEDNSLLLIGTCRIHRPYARLLPPYKNVEVNMPKNHQVKFLKMGYFHTSSEAAQIMRFIHNPLCIPANIREFVFRIEKRSTTPFNEFSEMLEASMRQKESSANNDNKIVSDVKDFKNILVEISSLKPNFHAETGIFMHHNPNLRRDVGYKEFGTEGYFAKYEPLMSVKRLKEGLEDITSNLSYIKKLCRGKVIICGHLTPKRNPIKNRQEQNKTIQEACSLANVIYVDTSEFVEEYGFLVTQNGEDQHHLSNEGELSFGKHISKLLK